MNTPDLRARCARALESAASQVPQLTAFVGLDGFVDEILHVVDKRESADKYSRIPTIRDYAARLAAAAGRSTNIELVSMMTKLGGNGPIMSNALASFGITVTYLGNLGYPNIHPVFTEFARRANVHSIAQPGFTDAYEFEDGKLMVGKHQSLRDVNWKNITGRFGRENFIREFGTASLVGFVNWTMLTELSAVWETVLAEICPGLSGPRRKIFFDLADPEKRTEGDIRHALGLIGRFGEWFDVILGLNEKEAGEIGRVLGFDISDNSAAGLSKLGLEIRAKLGVDTLVIHPSAYALAITGDSVSVVDGAFVSRPMITTGAGDHFNSGFCFGKLLGFDNAMSLLCGVATSGYYVRTAKSPDITDLVGMMRSWPASEAKPSGL
jgi:sugar/nucleoside kinase (ribokinase family)